MRAARLLLFVGAFACRPAARPPADFAEQLAAFRAEHEAEIGGPHGPLSTVAAHYVEPGRRIELSVVDGRVVETLADAGRPASDSAGLSIAVSEGRIECTRGCGDAAVSIDAPREVQVAPFSFGLGPQSGALRVLVHDPRAPARAGFRALSWYPQAPRWWLTATLDASPDAQAEPLATTRGLIKPMRPAGTLRLRLPDGQAAELVAYEAGPDELLVPFTDPTNGDATYDVGRYLTVTRPADAGAEGATEVVVDFNRATNPWCAYSEHYNCPIPPAENRLPVAVDAGERRYP